ncbi:MAG: hypothetical protein WBP44_05310 [Gammaproteobacteria bacterium]|jgi:uncharacterized membrane protein YuzA (DUF378 family)
MSVAIVIFGLLTLLAGVVIIINPEIVFGYLGRHLEKPELHILAILVRLVLGALLVYLAGVSRFPLVIEVIGWLSIIAAITFTVIGRNNFISLMSWAMSFQKTYGRVGGFIAVCFGGFLVYAFV